MLERYPCIRQRDETDCGAAVLATVARCHGLPLSVAYIRDLAGTDLLGTNLLGLSIAAEKIGFRATGLQAQWQHLIERVSCPVVCHVITEAGQNHFVVVHKLGRRKLVVADPATGTTTWTKEEFLARWQVHRQRDEHGEPVGESFGVLLMLAPTPALRQTDNSRSRWSRLWAILRPRLPLLWEAFLCSILATLLALGASFFIQVLIDQVLVHEKPNVLDLLALGMFLLILFRTAFGLLRQYLLVHLAQKIDLELMLSYYGHLMSLPMRFFRTRRVGEVLSRINDSAKIRALIQGTTIGLLLDATMFFIASAVMLYYSWTLTLLVFAFLPLFMILVYLLNRPVQRVERQLMEQSADVEAHLVESLSGIATLKAFAAEGAARQKTETGFVKVIRTGFQSAMLGASAAAIGDLLAACAMLFVLWYGGHLVIAGQLSLGQLMFFNAMLGYLVDPMKRLAEVNISIQEALIALDRLGEVMDLEPESRPDAQGVSITDVQGAFEIENLTFAYGHRPPVLKNISLSIPAGTTLGIVGESGCGKTTLANLLARFDDPQEGRILLDGTDIRDWNLKALRKTLGIVPQETFIFRGKVRENITLGKPGATLEQVIAAARAAGAHEFISQLPHRYETMIGERGSDLSGGQRQRLAIARALLHDPQVLILDEATSSLDSLSELAIRETLARVTQTTVLIAHRLSTVMQADLIVVLHDGRVVEQGAHDELMAREGRYHALWQRQLPSAPDLSRRS